MASGQPPRASIIVALAEGAQQSLRCFMGIAGQGDAVASEVIVVDNASVGHEQLLARLDGDVEVVRTERRLGFGEALAVGASRAHADILVLIRAAAAPRAGWLKGLVDALEDPSVGLAASCHGQPEANPVGAWSVAVRAADLAYSALQAEADTLVFPSLALAAATRGQSIVSVAQSVVDPPAARATGARRRPGEAPELTIVVPTLDATSDRVRGSLAAIEANTDAAHEIVIVDNGSPPQGFSAPVNAGLRAARTPYVVVMNDDVEPLPGWWAPLRVALEEGASVVFPLTVGGAMRFDFAAWCFALRAETAKAFSHADGEFFDPALVIWYQDTDLLHRLRKAGRPPQLVESSHIRHGLSVTVASEDPDLRVWIERQAAADRAAFVRKNPDAVLNGYQLAS